MEEVILVDKRDNEIGKEEKLKAHKQGKLHRAFSIFVFNSKNELLIHKRSKDKYHSGGLWTNTCCSHPRPGEKIEEAAKRRLKEEMGLDCKLKKVLSFVYKKEFGNGLIENEYDHVFIGNCDIPPNPDEEEVEDWKWINIEELKKDIQQNQQNYTYWFKFVIDKVIEKR